MGGVGNEKATRDGLTLSYQAPANLRAEVLEPTLGDP